jgi:phage N-6-adenine-methyltransferase
MTNVHFGGKGSEEWPTPQWFVDELAREFGPFELDPCATDTNRKAPKHFTKADDGLAQTWAPLRVFMNPPYGRGIIEKWCEKAAMEARRGALVVGLIPARTDTRWFHRWVVEEGAEVRFVKGRLTFEGSPQPAMFASLIVIWRPFAVRSDTQFLPGLTAQATV